VAIGATVLVLCAILVSLYFPISRHYQRTPESKLPPGTTVLITEFRNNTEDKRFDATTELVRHQLMQSPFFTILEPTRIRDSLEEMRKLPDSPLTPDIAREVALRNGAARVVFGAIYRVGDSYILDIEIERPDNDPRGTRATWNTHLTWSVGSTQSSQEIPRDFLNVVREGSNWVRLEVGESANDIARIDVPPQDVTTDNWGALSEFISAERFKSEGRPEDAIVALHNAVDSDPHFALAYMRLGDLLISMGRFNEGYRAYREALSEGSKYRMTRRERDRLLGMYASDTDNFAVADSVFQDYTAYYPNDYLGWFYRAYPLMMLGKPEEAITALDKAAATDPQKMFAPAHIARFDLVIGDYADTAKWIRQLRDHAHEEDADLVEGELLFLQNRYEEAQERFGNLEKSKDPHYHSYSFSLRARVYAETGRYREALTALKLGSEADLRSGQLAQRANKLFDTAYIELKRHRYSDCLLFTSRALDLDRSFQADLAAATILGTAVTESSGPLKEAIRIALRDVEVKASREELRPLSEIVRLRMKGELYTSAADWALAIDQFQKASVLEPPAIDRGRLIHALTVAVQHSRAQTERQHLCKEAGDELDAHRVRPGQVWQWALDYPPGYLSDQTFEEIRVTSECKTNDSSLAHELNRYLEQRRNADANTPDVDEARALAISLKIPTNNSNERGKQK
jgi:tetratricopeptide (TPR) repeat protein